MEEELKQLLNSAINEVTILRRRNEILEAKVSMIELFELVFNTKPNYSSQGMGEDIIWKMRKYLEEKNKDA